MTYGFLSAKVISGCQALIESSLEKVIYCTLLSIKGVSVCLGLLPGIWAVLVNLRETV